MKYSIVNGLRKKPFKKGKGICIYCGSETIAKCGNINVPYWAHVNKTICDSWWENETEWHRMWKNYFPNDWQEIRHYDNHTNEKHIADIKTDYGLIIELQNSPISIEEMVSREEFYNNMIWIINGKEFGKNFEILNKLPNINHPKYQDYRFLQASKKDQARLFFLHSEDLKYNLKGTHRIYGLSKIAKEIEESYVGHHLVNWKNIRKGWLLSTKLIFIDFPDKPFIYRLIKGENSNNFNIVRKYNKNYIINRILNSKKKY